MLHIACCLWDENRHTQSFSLGYDELWVEKLYRGFKRNLTRSFRFVVFTDRVRAFCESIEQERLRTKEPSYGCMIEPFRLNEPTIICGLDTIILRNVDHFADYCLSGIKIAAVRDPYRLEQSINPIVLVPPGHGHVAADWRGENDMEYMRRQDTVFVDDLWPGEVLSLKAHDVRRLGTQNARIIYFHGRPKPPQLGHVDWVKTSWI